MIDIENKVFDTLKTALTTSYPSIGVYGTYINVPSSFPCVTVIMDNNTPLSQTQTGVNENHSEVSFSINVYSNDPSGKKKQAKAIAGLIDTTMLGMKFDRQIYTPAPNIDDSVFRITMRYRGVVGKGVTVTVGENTTTTHQIYRR